MASTKAREEALAYTKRILNADDYVEPFDGCTPRKVNAQRAKEILVRPINTHNITQISFPNCTLGWPIQPIHAPALLSKVQKTS
jgi:hypothetical protein